jgi:hypothetical protein
MFASVPVSVFATLEPRCCKRVEVEEERTEGREEGEKEERGESRSVQKGSVHCER